MTHDLILFERGPRTTIKLAGKTYGQQSKKVVEHLYLCSDHYEQALDFMRAYEGKE